MYFFVTSNLIIVVAFAFCRCLLQLLSIRVLSCSILVLLYKVLYISEVTALVEDYRATEPETSTTTTTTPTTTLTTTPTTTLTTTEDNAGQTEDEQSNRHKRGKRSALIYTPRLIQMIKNSLYKTKIVFM